MLTRDLLAVAITLLLNTHFAHRSLADCEEMVQLVPPYAAVYSWTRKWTNC